MTKSTSPSSNIFNRISSFFKDKSETKPDEDTFCLFGDHERYSLFGTVKEPYYVQNTDEAGTPQDQCYWAIKWASHDKASCANASDFDELIFAYGADAAKTLWSQMSHPSSGHAANIKGCEVTEISDFEALCSNMEKTLKELEDNYHAFEMTKSAWF